jgi:hypothetical protein
MWNLWFSAIREYTASSPSDNTSFLFDSERFDGVDDLDGLRGNFFIVALLLSLVLLQPTEIALPIRDVPTLLPKCNARKSM